MAYRTTETDRGTFAFKVEGNPDGLPLVFVPGLGDDKDSWDGVLPGFAEYRCISIDNRGIGSSPISDGPYSAAQMAEDLHAVLRSLGVGPAPIIGSSMGGAISQELALAHPEDVSKLILTNTWARTDGFVRVLMEHWAQLAEANEGQALWDSMFLFCFSPDYIRTHPEIIEEFRALPVPDLRGFAAAAAACRTHDTLDRLAGISSPTLVIAGNQDILTEPGHSYRIAERVLDSTLESIDAGHLIFGEQPEQWIRIVSGFLQT